MKKWLCLALALLTLTVCVWAAAESTDWNYDLNYAILRGYNGAGGDVTVPAEIDGYTVDVIGVSVFSSEAITSLTLPETVLELRSNAVSGCENMTSVTLPQSLVVINLFYTNGNLLKASSLRGLPTALTGDDLISAIGYLSYKNRLKQTIFFNRSSEFFYFLFFKLGSRLIGIRSDSINPHLISFPYRNLFNP